jgi:hypothetical protein
MKPATARRLDALERITPTRPSIIRMMGEGDAQAFHDELARAYPGNEVMVIQLTAGQFPANHPATRGAMQ